jgi:Flp pilus assembly protein protease CpaA
MYEYIFLAVIGVIWLIIASVMDIKNREVKNWVGFSLITFALAYRLIFSIVIWNFWFFIEGAFGLIIFFILAYVFYYARVFAGGDAKIFIALGTILPFSLSYVDNIMIFVAFILFLLFVGAIYGLLFSFVIVLSNYAGFKREFSKQLSKNKNALWTFIATATVLFMIILLFTETLFLLFPVILILFPLLYIYAKSIEESCMMKYIDVKQLTVGDWLVGSIKVKSRVIKTNFEGLSEEDLKFMQKNYNKKVLVKQGIPFIPVFLIAFILLIILFNSGLWEPYRSFWQFLYWG